MIWYIGGSGFSSSLNLKLVNLPVVKRSLNSKTPFEGSLPSEGGQDGGLASRNFR